MFNLCTIQIMFKFRHVQLPFHKFNLRYYTTKYCLMLEIHRQTKPLMVTINMVFSCLVYFVCLAGYLLTSYTAKQYPAPWLDLKDKIQCLTFSGTLLSIKPEYVRQHTLSSVLMLLPAVHVTKYMTSTAQR